MRLWAADEAVRAGETQLVDQSVEAEGTVPLRFFVAHAKAFEELYAESERALAVIVPEMCRTPLQRLLVLELTLL